MEEKTKAEIARLHESGLGYKAIAKKMLLSVNTVAAFFRRSKESKSKCDECCKPLNGKHGRFCSDSCRYKWWKTRRNCGERVCPICGKTFVAKDLRRTYCSRTCYYVSRIKDDE